MDSSVQSTTSSGAGCSGYFGTDFCLQDVQSLSSQGASAVKIFDVLKQPNTGKNETLLIIAHKDPIKASDSASRMGQGSLYTWAASSSSFIPHPTMFTAVPTDGAVCLENTEIDGRHIIVICQSSACKKDQPWDPVNVSKENAGYVGPEGSCSVVYEWRNSSLTLLQILPVYAARSVTAFTRPSKRRGVRYDHYLLVAGSGSVGNASGNAFGNASEASSESVLLHWETSVSMYPRDDPLFQGYARVREIYTKEPRRWAVHSSGSLQFAALAAAGHFQATSDTPYPQLPLCQSTACFKPESDFVNGKGLPPGTATPSAGIPISFLLECAPPH